MYSMFDETMFFSEAAVVAAAYITGVPNGATEQKPIAAQAGSVVTSADTTSVGGSIAVHNATAVRACAVVAVEHVTTVSACAIVAISHLACV